ncbi:MAG: peptide ABC transporter substrate-binding protein, partial [Opitutaceae bacterium]|nr:peptide ABC transporter substrate-binding protein [Opitutaceae bacterium]
GGILLQSIGAIEPALDPHLATTLNERVVLTALLEGLVQPDPKTLEPRAAVAERWTISDDGLTYTFHLRAEARWSNGDPVTAHDFVASVERALSPRLASTNAGDLMTPLRGARAFLRGELTDFSQVGAAAVDARTLRLTLEAPCPQFLAMLTHFVWLPVHPPTVRAHGGLDDRTNRWARAATFVGNGPFRIKQEHPGQSLELEANPAYWNAGHIALRGVTFFTFTEKATEEKAFRSGQIHLTEALPNAKLPTYRRERPEVLRVARSYGTYIYRINTTRPPLDDARVRRALSHAINRRVLVDRVLNQAYEPALSFTPPGPAGYQPPQLAVDDAARARVLLAEAGFPGGAGLRQLEILFNRSEDHQAIAEAIQAMWNTELGLNITLLSQEQQVALANRKSLNYDISRASWFADYSDPISFLQAFTTGNANNQTGWSHAGYDRLVAEASVTLDPAARLQKLAAAEEILLTEAPVIPIHIYSTIRLIDPRVQGWFDNALDQHPFDALSLAAPAP